MTAADRQRILDLYRTLTGDRWPLLAAQGWVESRFDEDAVSPSGALGIAQFMPQTWEWAKMMGWAPKGSLPTDPRTAIIAQAHYMAFLDVKTGHNTRRTLASYNWGLRHVMDCFDRDGVHWENYIPRETYAYIRQVLCTKDYIKEGLTP